jgi:nucleotide-binding universal stress UspA family protein
VPIDFSVRSLKALQYAVSFAREHDAEVILVHILPAANTEYSALALLQADATPDTLIQLNKLAEKEVGKRALVEVAVRTGAPATEILKVAREMEVDLIIISTHGRTGLTHLLMGSVAEEVVQKAPCPVLVVRQKEHEFLRS